MADLSGVKFVLINGQQYKVEGTVVSLDNVKEVAVGIEPSLENADPVINGDTVEFKYRAGTKGADITTVIYNNQEYTVKPGTYTDPKQIKDAMAESFPELANADYIINEGTMTFKFRAGTKGQA